MYSRSSSRHSRITPAMMASVTIYTGVSALWKGSKAIIKAPAATAASVIRQPRGIFDRFSPSGKTIMPITTSRAMDAYR